MARAKKFGEIRNKETGEVLVKMMGPRAEDDPLSVCLRVLTHQLKLLHPDNDWGDGFFGGPFGYGVDFENDLFEMHPDWQGDCTCGATEPIHSTECRAVFDVWLDARNDYGIVPSTPEEIEAEVQESIARGLTEMGSRLMACARPWSFERVEEYERLHPRPECICDAKHWVERDEHEPLCRLKQRCFTYKPSGFVLNWYKYIGRDNEVIEQGTDITLSDLFESCLRSVGAPSLEESFAAYVEAVNEHEQAFKEQTTAIFGGQE